MNIIWTKNKIKITRSLIIIHNPIHFARIVLDPKWREGSRKRQRGNKRFLNDKRQNSFKNLRSS